MTTRPSSLAELTGRLTEVIESAIDRGVARAISLSISSLADDGMMDIGIDREAGGHGGSGKSDLIYDLASLTKIIGTTASVALAIAEQRMSLGEMPFFFWPGLSILRLLDHTSGLPAHRKFYQDLGLSAGGFVQNRARVFQDLWRMRPEGQERVYSDLGFMALGKLLEERYRLPLSLIFERAWKAIDGSPTFEHHPSRPLAYRSCDERIAPTGYCQARGTMVQGQVHDANCFYMGGLEGHAGLFGTMTNVKKMGRYFLRAYLAPSDEAERILGLFARRSIGFDRWSPSGSNRYLSQRAFGHFGFTGTSLWMDPTTLRGRGMVMALLTNRVYMGESPESIYWLRCKINQTIARFADRSFFYRGDALNKNEY